MKNKLMNTLRSCWSELNEGRITEGKKEVIKAIRILDKNESGSSHALAKAIADMLYDGDTQSHIRISKDVFYHGAVSHKTAVQRIEQLLKKHGI